MESNLSKQFLSPTQNASIGLQTIMEAVMINGVMLFLLH
jgi:hypothetical protein